MKPPSTYFRTAARATLFVVRSLAVLMLPGVEFYPVSVGGPVCCYHDVNNNTSNGMLQMEGGVSAGPPGGREMGPHRKEMEN